MWLELIGWIRIVILYFEKVSIFGRRLRFVIVDLLGVEGVNVNVI